MSDRLVTLFTEAVKSVQPTRFLGVFEFEVVSGDTSSAELKPTDPDLGLPEMVSVATSTTAAGERVTYAAGTLVLLSFVNGNPARPVVLSRDASKPALDLAWQISGPVTLTAQGLTLDGTATTTIKGTTITLGTGAAFPVARITDPVQAGPFSGVITGGSPGGVSSV